MAARVDRLGLLLAAALLVAALLAGCGGPGWARLDGASDGPPGGLLVFESVSAQAGAAPGFGQPGRAVVLAGRTEREDVRGRPLGAWQVLALVEPSDVPGRMRAIVLVGRENAAGRTRWQLCLGREIQYWTFARRFMLDGAIEQAGPPPAADAAGEDLRRLAACLRPGDNRKAFRKTLARMVEALEAMRSGPAGPARAIDESLSRLRGKLGILSRR